MNLDESTKQMINEIQETVQATKKDIVANAVLTVHQIRVQKTKQLIDK